MSERKPKERKPLFNPGSVLGGGTDILSSVLNNYAESTGQPAPILRQEEPAPPAEFETDPTEEPQAEEPEPVVEEAPKRPERRAGEIAISTRSVSKTASQPADKPARQPKTSKPKKAESAKEEADRRAQSPLKLCSFRIPEGLDHWLEEQAFEHRHDGLKKQDLVAQAIQLLIMSKALHDGSDEDEA